MNFSFLISLLSPSVLVGDYSTGVTQGILAAVIFTIGSLLIVFLPKYKWTIATLLLIGITPLVLGGFWFSNGTLGISDWDYYYSYHHAMRESIIKYHVFPFWNPYTCGGTAGLSDPEFPLFTIAFPLELIFGVPAGIRLAIFVSTATFACGMLHLSRRLGLGVFGALIAAIAASFGTVNILENVEGHQNILAVMWIPWMFLVWYNAYQKKSIFNHWMIWCAVFLALMFYRGGIYLLMYVLFTFIGFLIVCKDRLQALRVISITGLIALGLSAAKLIPVALWLSEFQDKAYASSTFTLPYLQKIFLGRYIHGAEGILPNQGSGWHEYGAYVGPFIIGLALLGLFRNYRRRFVVLLNLGMLAAILISSSGPFLKPIFDELSFLPRSNISRFILFAVIPLSYIAGVGTDSLTRSKKYGGVIAILLLAIVSIDLFSLAYPLSQQAFVLPDVTKPPSPAKPPIEYSAFEYKTRYNGVDYTRAYAATRAGYGSLSYCSVLSPTPAVRTIHDEGGHDIISLSSENKKSSFSLAHWDPNTVIVNLTAPEETVVTLNANYANGWYANGIPAEEKGNRVGITVPPGTTSVKFEYKTPGFIPGLLITMGMFFGLLGYGIRYAISAARKKDSFVSPS